MGDLLRSVFCGVMAGVLLLAPLAFADNVSITDDGSGNVAVNISENASEDGAIDSLWVSSLSGASVFSSEPDVVAPNAQVRVSSAPPSYGDAGTVVNVQSAQTGQAVSVDVM